MRADAVVYYGDMPSSSAQYVAACPLYDYDHSINGYTIEHVRCMIRPDDMHMLALALIAGIVPYRTGTTGLDTALEWFGSNIKPLEAGYNHLSSSLTFPAVQSIIAGLDTRTNQVPVGMLDLLRYRNTAGARAGEPGGDTICATATLTHAPGVRPVASVAGTWLSHGIICSAFSAVNAARPHAATNALIKAINKEPGRYVPLDSLDTFFNGRPGEAAGTKISKAKTFATYVNDHASIWSLTPRCLGEDMHFDVFYNKYADTPVYRVFLPTTG